MTANNKYAWVSELRKQHEEGSLSQEEFNKWDRWVFVWDEEEAVYRSIFKTPMNIKLRVNGKIKESGEC